MPRPRSKVNLAQTLLPNNDTPADTHTHTQLTDCSPLTTKVVGKHLDYLILGVSEHTKYPQWRLQNPAKGSPEDLGTEVPQWGRGANSR